MPCEDRCFWTQDRALRLGVQTLPLTRCLIGKSPDNGDGKSLVKYLFALVKYKPRKVQMRCRSCTKQRSQH